MRNINLTKPQLLTGAIFLSLCIIPGCGSNPEILPVTIQDTTPALATNPIADSATKTRFMPSNYYDHLPEMDGCSCYFAETEDLFNAGIYYYLSDYDTAAYIFFNDNWNTLNLVESGRDPDTFGDYDHVETYANDAYVVTVDIHYEESSGDEVWMNTGTITIESNGVTTVKEFIGECGC